MFDLTNISLLVSKLSIFLFIIAGNYIGDIYSCGLRHIFKEYMFVKHIIGFFIMLFFVEFAQNRETIINKIWKSLLLYIWFIFIMRSPTIITVIIIILIAILYLINLYIQDIKIKLEENEEINEKNNEEIELFTLLNNIIFVFSILVTLFGTGSYIYFLKKKYKNKFNIINFLLGVKDNYCFNSKNFNLLKKNPLLYDINKHK
jgi:hypothetical protein